MGHLQRSQRILLEKEGNIIEKEEGSKILVCHVALTQNDKGTSSCLLQA